MGRCIIDAERFLADFEALAQIGRTEDGAIHRVAYSEADCQGRAWLKAQLDELGIPYYDDPAANTIARYAGERELSPIGIGSHTDSVPDGGAYDGALGVVAALATVRALREAGIRLQHPVELINFAAEEATMAGGTTGSQAMAGRLDPSMLDKAAWDGAPVRDHLQRAGLVPDKILHAKRVPGSLAAFVELHIEQAKRLEQSATPIGIVEGFVGIRRYAVRFGGMANHAGTTSMAERDDALVKAAPYVSFVRQTVVELDVVGTVGDFTVYPGAPNVIPGRVDMVVEIRSLEAAVLDRVEVNLQREAERLGATFKPVVKKSPVRCDERIMDAIGAACERLGLASLRLSSGAGHDAMMMDALCPQAAFFVPSRNGISHNKAEYTSPEDCVNGANVLLQTVLILDGSV